MATAVRALLGLACALLLALPAPVEAATPAATPQPPMVPLLVALDLDNVYGFSSREKTYMVEGTLEVAAAAPVMESWLAAGVEPIRLVRFKNLVQPWDSRIEPNRGPRRRGATLALRYRFNGRFYSDEIDYRAYPFGALPLEVQLVPDANFPSTIQDPPAIKLDAQPADSGVSRRSNMDGYRLASWSYGSTPEGAELNLIYRPISWASLVKWLLPLTITMVVMLLTPNLRSSFSSERLAIPPVILLTLVFMQQAYRDTLPSLPYLTVLDGLYAFSYLVTLAFFCEFIWCANLMDGRSSSAIARLEPRVGRLELVLQLASLGGYAVLLAWAWGQR